MTTTDEVQKRREERQRLWTWEKTTEPESEPDAPGSTATERFALVWQLTQEAWAFAGKRIHEPGSLRHIIHISRREG